jgi:hypothetical protein
VDLPLRIPGRDPKGRPLRLRLDVVSGSYVGVDVSLQFQIEIHENEGMKKDIERMKAKKVRLCGEDGLGCFCTDAVLLSWIGGHCRFVQCPAGLVPVLCHVLSRSARRCSVTLR